MATRFEGRDFLSLRQEMVNFMKERLGEAWTDQGESDDLMTIIELLAYLGDNLHHYIDSQKRESDIVTAVIPRNVIQKATRDGYKPHMYVAATGTVVLTFDAPTPEELTIPRGTVFQTEDADDPIDNMQVVVTDDIIVPKDSIRFDVPVHQGKLIQETHSRADVTQSGYIRLNTDKISGVASAYSSQEIHGTTRFSFQNDFWTEVDDVYTDFRIGRLFSVHLKYLKNIRVGIVQLPYNWPLYITDLTPITIEYLQTDGSEGLVGANRITRCNSTLKFPSGTPASFTVLNPQPIDSGLNPEEVGSIKANFKSAIKDLETLVSLDDYEDFVRIYLGKECVAIDYRTAPSIVTDPRKVKILVDVNESQKESLLQELKNRQGRGDLIEVSAPIFKEYAIKAKVYLAPTGDSEEEILSRAESIINYNYRELPQRGNCHFRSEIVSFIHQASERVKSVELITPETDILPSAYEIPRYTSVSLEFEVTQWT